MEAWAQPVGNLSPRGASQRLRGGVFMLTIALALGVTLAKLELSPAWRLLLALPFFVAADFFYQGLLRT